jgi:Flp pilus assembly protein TadB
MQTNKGTSVAALVNSAISDGQLLVKQQIELAKSELSYSAKQAASTSGMLIGAGVLAFLAFVFMLVAGAYGLVAAGLPVWAGFLIVAGVLLLVAAILGLLGRARAKKVGPPQRAISQAQETKTLLAGRGGAGPSAVVAVPTTSVSSPVP